MKTILYGLFIAYCVSISWLYLSAKSTPENSYCIHIPNEQSLNPDNTLQYHKGTTWGTAPTTTTTSLIPRPYTYPYSVYCDADGCHIYIKNIQDTKAKEKTTKRKKHYDYVWCLEGRNWSKCGR